MESLKDFPFIDALEEGFEPEADVEFLVLDAEGGHLGSQKAHKLLLSFLSPVFRKQFFGKPVKFAGETKSQDDLDVVRITGPSFLAFQSLVQVLYSGDVQYISSIKDLDTLFQLFLLVDKYQIKGYKDIIKSLVYNMEVTNELELFNILHKYNEQYDVEDLNKILFMKCSDWEIPKTRQDVLAFWSSNYPEDPAMKKVLLKIHKEVKERLATKEEAPNNSRNTAGADSTVTGKAKKNTLAVVLEAEEVLEEPEVVNQADTALKEARKKPMCCNCKEVDCLDGYPITVEKAVFGMQVKAASGLKQKYEAYKGNPEITALQEGFIGAVDIGYSAVDICWILHLWQDSCNINKDSCNINNRLTYSHPELENIVYNCKKFSSAISVYNMR